MLRFTVVTSRWTWTSISLAVSTLGFCGCSDAEHRRCAIIGQVTLDGQPVQDATIIFTPKGEGLAAAASIVDGSFLMTEQNGPTRGDFGVRINPQAAELAEVEGHAAPLAPKNGRPKIPQVYQRDGKLTATITGQADQSLRFELSTREPVARQAAAFHQ
jgi:hypothetical protein